MLTYLIALSLLGIAVWWHLLRRLAPEGANVVRTADFGIGDAVFAALLASFFLLNIVASGGERPPVTQEMIVQGGVLYAFITFLILASLAARGKDPRVVFGLGLRGLGPRLGIAALALLAAYPIVYLAENLSQLRFPRIPGDDPMVRFLLDEATPEGRLIAAALIVIAAPITEELVFRGLIYGVLRRYGGRLAAILTTSLLFAAIHVEVGVILPLFVLAIALALAYELTGSLWVPITMHMAFNAASLTAILYFPEITR